MRTLYDVGSIISGVTGGGGGGGGAAKPVVPSAADAKKAEDAAAEEAARKAASEANMRQGRGKSLIASQTTNGTSSLGTTRRSLLGSA